MKVICTQENLKGGLAVVGRIISPSNTLPILNNILIKTENGMLKISSTNLEVAITTQIRCKVEEDGEVTVFAKTITDLVNNLPNKNITLETENLNLHIEADNFHTSIKTLPAEEFPLIPQIEGRETFKIPAQALKRSIDQVVFAASTNQTQPEISGVFLGTQDNELRLVATDRYRLAEKRLALAQKTNHPTEVIVPQKTIAELARIIGNQEGEVEITLADTQISMVFNQTQIISRLIDGQYPPYQQIIPEQFITTVATQKQPLINALKAGSIFSQNNNSIFIEYGTNEQNLRITAESQELGKSVVDLPSKVEGESGKLILNHRYVLDCLSAIESQEVVVKMINDSSPAIIVPEDQSNYTYLVMPIKS